MGRFDKFTGRARTTLQFAQEEAERFDHDYIGTEHILLGIVREGGGIAGRVLANMGISLDDVRREVETIIGRGGRSKREGTGEIGFTPRAKKVIQFAVDEAHKLNHQFIGTEHLLLGLLREGDGIGATVLEKLGINLQEARQQVLRVLNQMVWAEGQDIPFPVTSVSGDGAQTQSMPAAEQEPTTRERQVAFSAQAVLDEYGRDSETLAEIAALWRKDASLYREMYARLQTDHTALLEAYAALLARGSKA